MEKSPPGDFAANDQTKKSTQEDNKNPSSKASEASLLEKLQSFENEIDKEMSKNVEPREKTQEQLRLVKKKLGKARSSLKQYEKMLSMEKKSSFSQKQWLLESQSRSMSEDWQQKKMEKSILASPMMSNLKISYDILPSRSRLSLLSFAVFPEDAIIKKRPLTYWWAAEDWITKTARKTAREAGDEIFQELISKSLIQPWNMSKDTNISHLINNCTVNPWIRRMLINKAKEAQFFDFDSEGRLNSVVSLSRCFCLTKDNNWFSALGKDNSNLKELLTILNVNERVIRFRENFFLESNKLRVLKLGRWQASPYHHVEVENDTFLNELRFLKHLKYLCLRGISRITALPSSIVECRNLEILDLKACHNLETLPFSFSPLRKLTHLDMSQCYLLESMPYGLWNLSSLQLLKGFIIGKGQTDLTRLAPMQKLQKLSLRIARESEPQRVSEELASFSKMSKAKDLKNLTITWEMEKAEKNNPSFVPCSMDPEFLKKLEKLDLRRYPYDKSQDWLQPNTLQNLKKLYIRGGNLKELGSDQEWGSVEILRLKYLNNLKLQNTQVKKMFPHLIEYKY